jgi:hypothetical protein
MGPMDMISAFAAITAPIVATVLLSGRQTQRIIQATSTQTYRILEKLERCLIKMSKTQEDIKELQQKMYKDHRYLLREIYIGLKANARMHGWERKDGLTPTQIRRLPEPKLCDEELGVCYYKPG